jgi:hypothetical protein
MTEKSGTRQETRSEKWRRSLYGAAISLALFVFARSIADRVYPVGNYPLANQLFFMGTPFLALTLIVQGISSLGLPAASAINAVCWALLGAAIGLLVRRPLFAAAVWLLAAAAGWGLVFAALVFGMMSSSP